jgi:hypothetical protein
LSYQLMAALRQARRELGGDDPVQVPEVETWERMSPEQVNQAYRRGVIERLQERIAAREATRAPASRRAATPAPSRTTSRTGRPDPGVMARAEGADVWDCPFPGCGFTSIAWFGKATHSCPKHG